MRNFIALTCVALFMTGCASFREAAVQATNTSVKTKSSAFHDMTNIAYTETLRHEKADVDRLIQDMANKAKARAYAAAAASRSTSQATSQPIVQADTDGLYAEYSSKAKDVLNSSAQTFVDIGWLAEQYERAAGLDNLTLIYIESQQSALEKAISDGQASWKEHVANMPPKSTATSQPTQ